MIVFDTMDARTVVCKALNDSPRFDIAHVLLVRDNDGWSLTAGGKVARQKGEVRPVEGGDWFAPIFVNPTHLLRCNQYRELGFVMGDESVEIHFMDAK